MEFLSSFIDQNGFTEQARIEQANERGSRLPVRT